MTLYYPAFVTIRDRVTMKAGEVDFRGLQCRRFFPDITKDRIAPASYYSWL